MIQNTAGGVNWAGINTGLGYDGNDNMLVIEFDPISIGDPAVGDGPLTPMHVAVHLFETGQFTFAQGTLLAGEGPLPSFIDGAPHAVTISYVPGTMRVEYDGVEVLNFPVDLAAVLDLQPGGRAFVGFTAGMNGPFFGSAADHDILNWRFAPVAGSRGRTPGSVLVFPVHRSGPDWFTILSVTNTSTGPVTPTSLGGSTNVHFEYVNVVPNSADPFHPLGCTIFDRIDMLTPADTLSVLTTCHNAFAPGGQEGYVVVSAEDPALPPGNAWDHDYLIGTEYVLSASGVAYSVNAFAVQALSPNPAVAPAPLPFDGVSYSALPDRLYVDSFVALAGSSLSLINLTGGPSAIHTLDIAAWNDNEYPLSVMRTFSCWFDQPLAAVSPLFTEGFLLSTAHDPQELDIDCNGTGDLETGWALIQSAGVTTVGGTQITTDGALLGASTGGVLPGIDGERLLWQSDETQANGAFRGI